jgi:hypothetical protein
MLTIFTMLSTSYANEFVQLHSPAAEATSFLSSTWNKYNENYHPNYVLDGNPKTAWVEGVDGNGEGEQIVIPISSVSHVNNVKLRIRNGYQKSSGLLKANAAPKEILIEIKNRGGFILASKKTTLNRKMGWQEVTIKPEDNSSIQMISITILSSHLGTKYKDNCISDIEVFVDSETEYNQQVEEAKLAELHQWTSDRLETAVYFANKPKEYPFSSEKVSSSKNNRKISLQDQNSILSKTIEQQAIMNQVRSMPTWYTRNSDNKLEHSPDGLYITLAPDIWDISSLELTKTIKEYDTYKNSGDENENEEEMFFASEQFVSNIKLQKRDDGTVEYLYYKRHYLEQGRGVYGDDSEFLCHYDNRGRLTYVFRQYVDLDSEWEWLLGEGGSNISFKHYAFDYDQNDKIHSVKLNTYSKNVYVNDKHFYRIQEDGEEYFMALDYVNEEEKKQLIGKSQTQEVYYNQEYSLIPAITSN